MRKALLICLAGAAMTTAAGPAAAGDRPAAKLKSETRAVMLREPAVALGAGKPLSIAPAVRVRLTSDVPDSISFQLTEPRARPDWNINGNLAETTASAGGTYAVRDHFAGERKPRFRKSALGALLVLRIDGEEESPPLSVGGGGVAAALWGAVPRP